MYICNIKHKNYIMLIWKKKNEHNWYQSLNNFLTPPPPHPLSFRKKLTVFFWGAIALTDDDLHLQIKILSMLSFIKIAIQKCITWIYKFDRRKNVTVLTLRARCRKGRLPKIPYNSRLSLVEISHSNAMASK